MTPPTLWSVRVNDEVSFLLLSSRCLTAPRPPVARRAALHGRLVTAADRTVEIVVEAAAASATGRPDANPHE
jgi:hypothetical protein